MNDSVPPFIVASKRAADDKTIEQRRAEYEQSALKQLMDANGHEICERCYCCDAVWEQDTCGVCGGFTDLDDEETDWPSSPCFHCGGEGEVSFKVCLGGCDERGNHAPKPPVEAVEIAENRSRTEAKPAPAAEK